MKKFRSAKLQTYLQNKNRKDKESRNFELNVDKSFFSQCK